MHTDRWPISISSKDFAADKIRDALNYHLRPDPVAVIRAEVASSEFHARFDAIARHYLYRLVCRKAPLVLERGRAWQVTHALDCHAMHEAAQLLVGSHDFTTFRAAECQAKSPVKTLDKLNVSRVADEIHIVASARSFLHHQVRSIAGSLKLVGEGKWKPRDVGEALEARERARCGPVAPPDGLYLVRVDYL
jgi:tRNA pseudouridine38-40 synthase